MRLYRVPSLKILGQLAQAEAVVREAANKYWANKPDQHRKSLTTPCVPEALYTALLNTDLPREHSFASLGSGFGLACFAAALYFAKVTGFEKGPDIFAVSNRLKVELGLNKVTFINQDFLTADLSGFQIIHFFQPFVDDFQKKMGDLLNKLVPGTVIAADIFSGMRESLFPPSSYSQLYPFADQVIPPNIHVFRKK